ncbi:MAG TPA: sigma-54 dependent transcriptional regulator [Candidatus Cloacimonadota bacterium]|nr:sigma-54 dependent transcriptional regulator [Candidatus Cloacimonadota bacterium]HQB41096.1 sigma-54 dependent transcriptional regulator [Candidatus Cloacimonadota bacterium]
MNERIMQKQILIADDESLIRDFIASFFDSIPDYNECKLDMAVNGEDAIAKIKNKKYDLIFTDLKMPIKTGLDVLKFVAENSPDTDTVLLTAYGGPESAAQAMAYGAYEYITKPISLEELEMIVKHIFERQELITENQKLQKTIKEAQHYSKIIGKSKSLSDIMDLVKMVSPTNSTVLITGESGTGKELIAEAIHALSPRHKGNFIKINCAAIPESLIESELFGFEKGSFTGAIKNTRGKFELADKGSILLDEISEMNLDLQAKLLRVIQEREIVRIGTEMPIKIDTRIIATSNRDLVEEVKKGNFREDLFFRLNIVPIHIPSLRYRKEDIPSLVESFIKKVCFELGINKKTISQDALNLLVEYDWPGNIRELQNAIERACITTPEAILKRESFLFLSQQAGRLIKNDTNQESIVTSKNPDDDLNYVNIDNRTIERIEKEIILKTLKKTGNSKQDTARILGITTRTLRNKLDIYNDEDGANY